MEGLLVVRLSKHFNQSQYLNPRIFCPDIEHGSYVTVVGAVTRCGDNFQELYAVVKTDEGNIYHISWGELGRYFVQDTVGCPF